MSDITMCRNNESCPLRNLCYRSTAKPDPNWQSYFVVAPCDSDGSCDWFWSSGEETKTYD